MRAFNGKSRIWIWLLRLLIIAALLACVILAYHHYMFGNIKVNMQYITSENLNLIIENREKLIQSGLFDPWEGKVYFDMDLVNLWQFEKMIYHCPENPNILFAIYYPEELWWEKYYPDTHVPYDPTVGATYERNGFPSIFYQLGRREDCTSTIWVDNGLCLIYAKFLNTDGTARDSLSVPAQNPGRRIRRKTSPIKRQSRVSLRTRLCCLIAH